MVDALPFVGGALLLVGNSNALCVFRQNQGIDVLGTFQTGSEHLLLHGGCKGCEIGKGHAQTCQKQHAAQQHRAPDMAHKEANGGTIIIDIQHSGVLGSENDVLDNILAGGDTIDISRISAFALTSYGCQKSKLLSLPFTFVSREHFWAFANSDLAPDFLNEPQTLGLPVRGIFYGEEGFRHFFTATPIASMDDLAGLKLRVSNDPVMNGMVNALGASPTVVSFGELYSALSSGVCDGAEQPIANYRSNAFPEVAPYIILDGHTLGAIQAVITDKAWAKLTPDQQAVILEAGKLTQAYNATISAEKEAEVLELLKSEGVTVIENVDKAALQAACAPVTAENTKGLEDLYQQILDMAG